MTTPATLLSLQQYSQSCALVDNQGTTYSYAQLHEQSCLLQEHLIPRTLIFCLCTNSPGSLLSYLAAINHGLVPLLLDANLDKDLLDNLINIYKPDYISVASSSPYVEKGTKLHEAWGYSLIKMPYTKTYPLHEDLALLLTTSGSTGSPKLVRHSYENLRSNIVAVAEYLGIDSTERAITTLPMHYTYGLSVLHIHLHAGASLILTDESVVQKGFWALCKDYEATSLAGVPYTFEMLHRLRFFRMELPALRSMNQAGGKMPPELQKQFIEFAQSTNKKFCVMYGQTEASPRMGYLPWEKAQEKYGSMGIAIPGGSFTLIDEHGHEIMQSDSVGELIYKGPNVTMGYAQCGEDLYKGDERQGVLATGDMAKYDDDGFYTIVGRQKRFLKLFGNRVSLDASEHLIKEAFDDLACICAGVDNKMYIFIQEPDKAEAIHQFITAKTKLHFSAFKVIILDSFPISSAGKVQYTALEKHYDE